MGSALLIIMIIIMFIIALICFVYFRGFSLFYCCAKSQAPPTFLFMCVWSIMDPLNKLQLHDLFRPTCRDGEVQWLHLEPSGQDVLSNPLPSCG